MLLTSKQLAERWGLSEGTLRNWRSLNVGPKFIKLGRKSNAAVRYSLAVVKAFERSHKHVA
jgi:hypothetical protein